MLTILWMLQVVMVADGQVTLGSSVLKPNVQKLRRISDRVIGGFAGYRILSFECQSLSTGSTADAFTLFDNLEIQIEKHPGVCNSVSRV